MVGGDEPAGDAESVLRSVGGQRGEDGGCEAGDLFAFLIVFAAVQHVGGFGGFGFAKDESGGGGVAELICGGGGFGDALFEWRDGGL